MNQRLPSGPAVIPQGSASGGRDGELGDGDGQQATIFQPFEPGPCPDPVGGAAAGGWCDCESSESWESPFGIEVEPESGTGLHPIAGALPMRRPGAPGSRAGADRCAEQPCR